MHLYGVAESLSPILEFMKIMKIMKIMRPRLYSFVPRLPTLESQLPIPSY